MPQTTGVRKAPDKNMSYKKVWWRNRVSEKQLNFDLETMSEKYKNKTFKFDIDIEETEKMVEDLQAHLRQLQLKELEPKFEGDTTHLETDIGIPIKQTKSKEELLPEDNVNLPELISATEDAKHSEFCKRSNCHYFPCTRPKTYHTIGFRPDLPDPKWTTWDEIVKILKETKTFKNKSILRKLKCPMKFQIAAREQRWKMEFQRKKKENDKKKPKHWVTNYGTPMPNIVLKYPVRPLLNKDTCRYIPS